MVSRDTVASVGMLNARRMPFTASNTIIRTFRHAISLDERRARFQVKTWSTSNVQEAKLDVVDQEIQLMKTLAKSEQNGKGKGKAKQPGKNELAALRELEKKYSVERTRMTDVKEVSENIYGLTFSGLTECAGLVCRHAY